MFHNITVLILFFNHINVALMSIRDYFQILKIKISYRSQTFERKCIYTHKNEHESDLHSQTSEKYLESSIRFSAVRHSYKDSNKKILYYLESKERCWSVKMFFFHI